MTCAVAASRSMKVPVTIAMSGDDEDGRGAQTVDAQQRRRQQRQPRRTGLQRGHAATDGDRGDAAPEDGGGLSDPVGGKGHDRRPPAGPPPRRRAECAAPTPPSRRRAAPPRAQSSSATPKLVGLRCVLMRSRLLPPPCSSTSARTSSHDQRPTRIDTSRSSDQPSSMTMRPTARDFRSQSTRSRQHPFVRGPLSLQKRSSATLPAPSSSARQASPSEGRGPRLVCGSAAGSATSGGERTPRIEPDHARERLEEVQVGDRRRDTRGGCPSAS